MNELNIFINCKLFYSLNLMNFYLATIKKLMQEEAKILRKLTINTSLDYNFLTNFSGFQILEYILKSIGTPAILEIIIEINDVKNQEEER